MEDMGLKNVLQEIIDKYIYPISVKFFPYVKPFVDNHSFTVEYQKGKDTKLGYHTDDSDITINLCLGKEFEGSGVYFRGIRCRKHQSESEDPKEAYLSSHSLGTAILHLGQNRHSVTPLTDGLRINLIIWCRSEERLGDSCGSYCGLFNKKKNK